jgi:hypothetical protein
MAFQFVSRAAGLKKADALSFEMRRGGVLWSFPQCETPIGMLVPTSQNAPSGHFLKANF